MAIGDVKDEDLKLNEQPDGSIVVGDPPEELDEHDEAPVSHEEDEAASASETSEDADARRERNRQRRQQNKESRKNYIESLKRELASRDSVINDLSTRMASVEQQSQGSQMVQLDGAIKEAADYYAHFKNVNRKAIEAVDGTLAVDAQEKMFAASQRHQMLLNAKKNMVNQTQQPRPLDPRLKQHAEGWIAKNDWYDPSGSDMDSDLVLKLDERLVKEGWNPTTAEYWAELDARVKKYLPHRANSGYNEGQKARQTGNLRVPVAGSSRESSGTGKPTSYHLSSERVAALKEAGTWEDPAKRADAIRRFKEYDANATANKGA